MSKLSEFEGNLTKKTGPLPNWAWASLAAAAVYLWIRRRNASKAAAAGATVQIGSGNQMLDANGNPIDTSGLAYTDPTTLNYPFGPNASFLASDPTNPAYPVGLTPQGVPAPVVNAQWARLAGDYLTGLGDDPTGVQAALSKYLGGVPLSQLEHAIVNQALTHFGSPPEGVMAVVPPATPTPTPTTPTPTPTTTPPAARADQFHRVGKVGSTYTLYNYIQYLFGNLTPAQINAEAVKVANDPRNKGVNELHYNRIAGGSAVWFPALP